MLPQVSCRICWKMRFWRKLSVCCWRIISLSRTLGMSLVSLIWKCSNITNTSLEHQHRYLLTNQPLVCQILRIMGYEKTATSTVDRKVWATIQISLLLFSYLIANIVPFFSSLQGIIGSALAAPIMFGWPPVFFLCCVRMKNHKLARSDMILCKWYLLVFKYLSLTHTINIQVLCFCSYSYRSVQ